MADSATDGLITIGVFARACGLTPGALRFYADCGLLVPARIDAATGYRYYTESQCARATTIRRLREIAVPLDTIAAVLAGDADEAARLLDRHVLDLAGRARVAATVAAAIKSVLRADAATTVSAAALAEAIEQTRAAAAFGREIPVLAGIFVESVAGALVLTATDRYRLTTRTLAPRKRTGDAWSVVIDTVELTTATAWLHERGRAVNGDIDIDVVPGSAALVLTADGAEYRCRAIEAPFPDYRAMLAALPPARTRAVVSRRALLDAVEQGPDLVHCGDLVQCGVRDGELRIAGRRLPATVSGPRIDLAFRASTLRPALVSAIGPDLMLDIASPEAPIVIRSATDGDLTTLAMPTAEGGCTDDH